MSRSASRAAGSARLLVGLLAAGLSLLAVAGSAGELRVMSFNLRYGTAPDGDDAWERRRTLVAATIAAFAPDLLGTQECLAFQRDQLLADLPGFAVVAVGRDDGGDAGEMCACFYRETRFALQASGTFWLSETPAVVASRGWDAALPRIATWLRLRDRATGRDLLWLNTHFDHQGAAARRASAALLHDWLAARADSVSLLVTGDFNVAASGEPGSIERTLTDGLPVPGEATAVNVTPLLRDTWTAVHGAVEPELGTFHGFGRDPRPGRIDWILTSPDLAVRLAAIDRTAEDGRWPSDHHPVVAVLAAE